MSTLDPGDPEYRARYLAGYEAARAALESWQWGDPVPPEPDQMAVRDWRRYLCPYGCGEAVT